MVVCLSTFLSTLRLRFTTKFCHNTYHVFRFITSLEWFVDSSMLYRWIDITNQLTQKQCTLTLPQPSYWLPIKGNCVWPPEPLIFPKHQLQPLLLKMKHPSYVKQTSSRYLQPTCVKKLKALRRHGHVHGEKMGTQVMDLWSNSGRAN